EKRPDRAQRVEQQPLPVRPGRGAGLHGQGGGGSEDLPGRVQRALWLLSRNGLPTCEEAQQPENQAGKADPTHTTGKNSACHGHGLVPKFMRTTGGRSVKLFSGKDAVSAKPPSVVYRARGNMTSSRVLQTTLG